MFIIQIINQTINQIQIQIPNFHNWLVVEPYPSEKWWSSSVGMMKFPTEWKNNPFMFQTTDQISHLSTCLSISLSIIIHELWTNWVILAIITIIKFKLPSFNCWVKLPRFTQNPSEPIRTHPPPVPETLGETHGSGPREVGAVLFGFDGSLSLVQWIL